MQTLFAINFYKHFSRNNKMNSFFLGEYNSNYHCNCNFYFEQVSYFLIKNHPLYDQQV